MEEMREIYVKTKVSLEEIMARHFEDLKNVRLILDSDIVCPNGDPMEPDELADVTKSLRDQVEELIETICTIKEQVKYFEGWLSTH